MTKFLVIDRARNEKFCANSLEAISNRIGVRVPVVKDIFISGNSNRYQIENIEEDCINER